MRRRITIDLDIDLNNALESAIDYGLIRAIENLAGDGWFTGATSAEVDEWSYTIENMGDKASVSPLPSKQMKG